ncbi:MAG: hypothetical protein ACFFCW_01845 [Candidatus Hodarchaeota archaeon]
MRPNLNRFEAFCVDYLSHRWKEKVPPFHRQIRADLNNPAIRYLAIEAFRRAAKSSIIREFVIFLACEYLYPDIQWIHRTGGEPKSLAVKNLGWVKQEFENNQLLIHDYGLRKGRSWGQDMIEIVRADGHKVEITSIGKRGNIRGGRGIVVIDDPQNKDDVNSDTILERDQEWLITDVIPVLGKDQRLIFLGTTISPLSLLARFQVMPGVVNRKYPILVDEAGRPDVNGHSVWPEEHPDEDVHDRKMKMGLERFCSEYMCMPMVSGNPAYRQDWIKWYDPKSEFFLRQADNAYVVATFDGSKSKRKGADEACLLIGFISPEKKPNIFIRKVVFHQGSIPDGVSLLFTNYEIAKFHKAIIEDDCIPTRTQPNNYGTYMLEVNRMQDFFNLHFKTQAVKPKHSKLERARRNQVYFQEGRVHFDYDDAGQQKLVNQLIMFTGDGKYPDDGVDALNMLLDECREHEKRGVSHGKRHISSPQLYGG